MPDASKKRCFKCGTAKPLGEFYVHSMMADGHLNKCKVCTKTDVRQRYGATRNERSAYERKRSRRPERKAQAGASARKGRLTRPDKYAARLAVANAVRTGSLIARPCETCGSTKVQAHHDDYSRPLDIRWLCFRHHREAHGQIVVSDARAPGTSAELSTENAR